MYKLTILPEEIQVMPLGSFEGEIKVIDRPGIELLGAVLYLRSQKIIGFDTETRPTFSPGQRPHKVALLQLSGGGKAYLFRINKLQGIPKMLTSLLSSPRILKVGAAVHDDIRALQKWASFKPKGFVDLQRIAWEWGIRDMSVKKLAANILGVRISKTQQLSNWEADKLSHPQQLYAATDAWICREMYCALLSSEKHPLTPEERNPIQPQAAAPSGTPPQGDKCSPDGQGPAKGDRGRGHHGRNRRRRRKPSGQKPSGQQPGSN